MPTGIADAVTLANGVTMPWLGLGTWKTSEGQEVEQSVRWALELGYRHIDTAALYGNEVGVGKAVRDSGVPRNQIFVTTKLWNEEQRQGPDGVHRAFDESLKKLGFDTVDLYLIHWPVKGHFKLAWRVLEELYAAKRVRAIGVSNFLPHHLEDLIKDAQVVPMVNQFEFHPLLGSPRLLETCRKHNIVPEAWSPLIQGRIGEIPEIVEIAKAHGRTPAQIALRWNVQKGVVTIPKSVKRHRIEENAKIFDFVLSADEMARIDAVDRNERVGPDPDTFTF